MGEARFVFTRDDLVAAQKAWWTGAARWQALLKFWAGLTLAYGAMAYLLSGDARGGTRVAIVALSVPFSLVMALILFAIGRLLAPLRARRSFREHKALAGEFVYRWNDEGMEITHDRGVVRLPWAILHGWLDAPTTLMLYQSSILFNAIPRRVLAPADLDAIVDRLRAADVREFRRFGLFASSASGARQPAP